jgi:hypothetical protein
MTINLTEADVLKGEAFLPVQRRDGTTVQAHCKALSWAAACKVMAMTDAGEAMLLTVLGGLTPEQANDQVLNTLTPEALNDIAATVLQLTHGVPALKKRMAAGNPSAVPAMPSSTPPPANCAAPGLVAGKPDDSALPSSPGI